MIEIERRFLCTVPDVAKLEAAGPPSRIRQGYLTAAGPAVRIRERDGRFTLTVKSGQGRVRREVEIPVGPEAAEALFEIAGASTIEKDRYVRGRWEVDVFHGKLAGMSMAEVELEREEEALPAEPPGVRLGREVTEDTGFTNQRLAALPWPEAERFVREVLAAAF